MTERSAHVAFDPPAGATTGTNGRGAAPSVGQVDLSFPVEDDLLVLARLAVSTVASRAGFDIEEVDDLRLAVDELCLLEVRGRRSGRLVLSMDVGDHGIEVWCHYEGDADSDDDVGEEIELSARILEALVDEHGLQRRDGRSGQRLSKRRPPADG
jgi:serine/threonine-protein kinase RsbW